MRQTRIMKSQTLTLTRWPQHPLLSNRFTHSQFESSPSFSGGRLPDQMMSRKPPHPSVSPNAPSSPILEPRPNPTSSLHPYFTPPSSICKYFGYPHPLEMSTTPEIPSLANGKQSNPFFHHHFAFARPRLSLRVGLVVLNKRTVARQSFPLSTRPMNPIRHSCE